MSNGFREVISLCPRPGRALSFVAFFLVPGALIANHLADIAPRWKAVALLALALGACHEIRLHLVLEHARRSIRASLLPDGRWRLEAATGDPVTAAVARVWGASLGPVMALEWECDDGIARRAWLVRRDLPERDWRRLRVRLRLA